ncbi:hypothetical protein ACFPRH_20060 [Streptomyces amakusaensis]|uniref:Transposase n=1 Tax=Streptomyces amakusaensis TaxID=67271 RepID=A0ABW0AJT5_9ACTN
MEQFSEFANTHPLQWITPDLDGWMTHLIGVVQRADSTIRRYRGVIGLL